LHAATLRKTWAGLTVFKGKYDPDNVFRVNQNIKPT